MEIGALNSGLRVIEKGLSMGERVILSGLQRLHPGSIVKPKLVDMITQERLEPRGGDSGSAKVASDSPDGKGMAPTVPASSAAPASAANPASARREQPLPN